MSTITPKPLFLTNCTVQIGTDSFEQALSQVQLDPANSNVMFKGLTPTAVFNFSTPSTWTATLQFAQDWTTADSLSNYLLANEGEKVTMTFVPAVDDTASPTITATVFIVPGSIGGSQGAVATSSVKLPVDGKPTVTPHA